MSELFLKGQEFTTDESSWRRTPPAQDWARGDVHFQLTDAGQYRTTPVHGMPGPRPGGGVNEVHAVRLFGVTRQGTSVLVHAHGFQPYFWIQAPAGWRTGLVEGFRRALNQVGEMACKVSEPVLAVEEHDRRSLKYFQNGDTAFLRIVVQVPGFVPRLRNILEGKTQSHEQGGIQFPQLWHGLQTFETFESNVLFELRFLVDNNIGGANWLTIPAGKYRPKPNRMSVCQIEVDVAFSDIVPHDANTPEHMAIAPLRTLSFDIECSGRPGKFPEAEHDPVIQIANVVQVHGQKEPLIQNVFCLQRVSPIPGVRLYCFEEEKDMLLAWAKFVVSSDPDVLTGYNIVNFDMPYLLDRARTLGVLGFPFWSRIRSLRTTMVTKTFQNKAHGKREYQEIEIPGRIQVDLLVVMQREHKLRSYSLNNVSHHFLGEQKEDVHHSMISKLQEGNEETRNRLARYCFKDALLPVRLITKLMILVNLVEMARVTGVPCQWLIEKGQQIKVFSQILRKCRVKKMLFPTVDNQGPTDGVAFEGATVIDPKKGFHNFPVATLDFASLYPSIMMAHNLCYSTLVPRDKVMQIDTHYPGLSREDLGKTPAGDWFVKKERCPGVLPEILRELLTARKAAKKAMKEATDPMDEAVYNGRQLAMKISANSVYGFTGATVGKLPCLEISGGVTSFGRAMIEATKQSVEDRYTKENGYPDDAEVIYGDTDSVMINFGKDLDLETSMKLGQEAAPIVSKLFPDPVKLEFEKCYFPYLLMNKKRYAGLLWTRPDKYDKLDCKGIESVRRDNCPLVAQVVNTVLRKILIERSLESAIKYVKQTFSDLLMNRIDISQLIISKALTMERDEYAGKQAHSELAERMRKRDPASAPQVGDRVPYVIIQAHQKAKAFEKSEDPLYALEHNTPIDTQHYMEHQLKLPLKRMFEGVLENVESTLFHGAHTRTISKKAPTTGGLMKFATVQLQCLGCKCPIKDGAVCRNCKSKEAEVYARYLSERNHFESLFSKVWTQCQRCQGSLHQDVICANKDCSVFYMRKKVQKDLGEAQKKVDRFGSLDW